MTNRDPLYRPRRFPAEIIAHAVWPSFRFAFAPAVIEDKLAGPGIIVSHQTVRPWAEKFGRTFANNKLRFYDAAKRKLMPDVALRLEPVHSPPPDLNTSHRRELREAALNLWAQIARALLTK